jgi:glutamate synthase (NADPH/NADH) small chain
MMGKITGFLEIDRQEPKYAPAADRIRHYHEFTIPLEEAELVRQAARCMDCGVPYCHTAATGCPVNNQIPDWNDLVYNGEWEEAALNLHSTNNFPEFTGRTCPAPCEEACTLNLENAPVTIKTIESAIVERAWAEGWVKPLPPLDETGMRVAIVGSGPAGLAAAQQLARVGHEVHVFERQARAGGLLRYGIPDFKMEKDCIDRRCEQLQAEGVIFHFKSDIGTERPLQSLIDSYDAVLLSCGAERPRDPGLPGMDLDGCHYAMPYLVQQNKRGGDEYIGNEEDILAGGKHVVVIGGGDTASDCVGTAFRQGALSVTQLDIRPVPPEQEDKLLVWPYWPTKFRTSTSQAEGAEREFSCATLAIVGENGQATAVRCARVDEMRRPLEGTEFDIRADLILIAIGFAGPLETGLLEEIDFERDSRSNVQASTDDYQTSQPKVFAAGDMRKGQSLVVWAIREGRQAARAIDEFLMGASQLPR